MSKKPAPLAPVRARAGRSTSPRLLLLIALVVAALLFTFLLRLRGFDGAFQLWNVPGYGVPFLDWALIPGSAESYARGLDPAIVNPGDPLQRLFNYPRIWYLFFRLPLSQAQDVPIGITIDAVFFLAVLLFPRNATPLTETLLFLAIISPAAMLGYSRANVDLLIFAAMVLALILVDRHALGALFMLIAAVLFKIFPILGIGLLLNRNKNAGLKLISGAAVVSLLYFGLTFRDLVTIFRITQKGYQEAYGVAVLPALLRSMARAPDLENGHLVFHTILLSLNNFLSAFPFAPYAFGLLLLIGMSYLRAAAPRPGCKRRPPRPPRILVGRRNLHWHLPDRQQFRLQAAVPVACAAPAFPVGEAQTLGH